MEHPLLSLARQTILRLFDGQAGQPPLPPGAESHPPQGCFVSLKAKKRLRGCMGTIFPAAASLEKEVAANAIAAAQRDPRFKPLRAEEVAEIHISIDILSPLEPVDSPDLLDPAHYGVVVRSGKKCGVLLPDLPGVTTPAKQIAICREKADIEDYEPVHLERFTVERIEE